MLALAAIAVPVLASCATSPGSAALVGDRTISVNHLQAVVRAALANPQAASQFGSNRAGFARQTLARLISEDIVAQTAAAHHVTVTAQDLATQQSSFVQQAGSLDALRQDAAQQGLPSDQLQDLIRIDALQTKLGQALIATQPVSQAQLRAEYQKDIAKYQTVHVEHILVKSHTLAQRLLTKVRRNPNQFASLAQRFSTDTGSKNSGGDLGFVGRGQTVAPFDKAIFSNPPGSYLLVHSQFGWHVIHILGRKTQSLAQATPSLRTAILSSKQTSLLQQAFVTESKRLHVHVSPRYGTWSPTSQSVTALRDPVSVGG